MTTRQKLDWLLHDQHMSDHPTGNESNLHKIISLLYVMADYMQRSGAENQSILWYATQLKDEPDNAYDLKNLYKIISDNWDVLADYFGRDELIEELWLLESDQ